LQLSCIYVFFHIFVARIVKKETMKKNVIVLSLTVGFMFVTSCKKDYACNCHYDETHDDHTHEEEVSYPLGKLSKQDAESACDEKETALAADPDHTHAHCDLKK